MSGDPVGAMPPVPPWWLLGEMCWAQVYANRHTKLELPPSTTLPAGLPAATSHPRARLQTVPEVDGSVRALRRRGQSLCSRQRCEREIKAARTAAAEEAENEALAAEEDVEETKRLLDEGLILANGAQAPPKRKRASGAEMDKAAKKAKEEAAAAKQAAKDAKAAEKAAKEAEKAAEKEAKAKAKALAKKGASAMPLFEPGAIVEVSLRLGEAYANWYEARLLELAKGGRWKLALQRRAANNELEPLLLEGRPATEWAKPDMLRPLPGEVDWRPSVSELCGAPARREFACEFTTPSWNTSLPLCVPPRHCRRLAAACGCPRLSGAPCCRLCRPAPGATLAELLFDDGWWKVKVQEVSNGVFTVHYAPANAIHTVPRERLRPMFTFEPDSGKFAPIKSRR